MGLISLIYTTKFKKRHPFATWLERIIIQFVLFSEVIAMSMKLLITHGPGLMI